jgi:hypothetical protein
MGNSSSGQVLVWRRLLFLLLVLVLVLVLDIAVLVVLVLVLVLVRYSAFIRSFPLPAWRAPPLTSNRGRRRGRARARARARRRGRGRGRGRARGVAYAPCLGRARRPGSLNFNKDRHCAAHCMMIMGIMIIKRWGPSAPFRLGVAPHLGSVGGPVPRRDGEENGQVSVENQRRC